MMRIVTRRRSPGINNISIVYDEDGSDEPEVDMYQLWLKEETEEDG